MLALISQVLTTFYLLNLVAAGIFGSPPALSSVGIATTPSTSTATPSGSCLPGAQLKTCTPSGSNCDFNNCVETEYHCSGTQYSYPTNYGHHFCERYSEKLHEFSAKGQVWVNNVRLYLQQALVKDTNCQSSCQQIYEDALDSHVTRYIENGVCFLESSNYLAIKNTVGIGTLLSSFNALKQTGYAALTCAGLRTIELWAVGLQAISSLEEEIVQSVLNAGGAESLSTAIQALKDAEDQLFLTNTV